MDIMSFDCAAGRPMLAYGSVGVSAQALYSGASAAVTVLQVAAGGEVGSHRAPVDQLLLVVKGEGAVQADGGGWEPVSAGQMVHWRAGEEHTTRAVSDLTAVVVEIAGPH